MIQLVSIISIALLVGADQLIKTVVTDRLMPIGRADFIPGIVEFNYTENTGAAFSLLENHTDVLSIITSLIIIAGLVYLMSGKLKNKFLISSGVLVLAGGIGNLIDRLRIGFVVDYIKVLFTDFAIFNFADCLVVVGAFMIIIYMIRDVIKENARKKGKKNG